MTIVLAAIFLGETIAVGQIIGGAIILAAVIVLARSGEVKKVRLQERL